MEVAVSKIKVGARIRKELGDIESLMRSIEQVGLLQPLAVLVSDREYQLIGGVRRLEACQRLGWDKVPVHFIETLIDARDALIAERDENTCRKDFTPEEAVYAARAIEELERPKAKERQHDHGGTAPGRSKENTSGKFPEVFPDAGRTRDKVADAVGMSGRTYEKAKAVVEARDKEPEKYQPLVDRMNATGKADGAYKALRREEDGQQDESELSPEVRSEVLDAFMDLWGRMNAAEKAFLCRFISSGN